MISHTESLTAMYIYYNITNEHIIASFKSVGSSFYAKYLEYAMQTALCSGTVSFSQLYIPVIMLSNYFFTNTLCALKDNKPADIIT